MNIDNITFINEHELIARPRLYGNVGDRVTCTIDITVSTAGVVYFKFLHNLVTKSTNPYQTGDFTINENIFASIQTGEISGSQGTISSGNLDFIQPYDNSATIACTVVQTSLTTFTITHLFEIQPYMQAEYVDSGVPDHFFAPECLKYVFKIECYDSEFAGALLDTTDTIDLSPYFADHDTGGWDETFNGRAPRYTTNLADGQLYGNSDSDFYFNITTTETFTTGTDVVVHLQEVTDTYGQNLMTATKKERIVLTANNTTQVLGGIGEAIAELVDTNLIQVRIKIYQGSQYDSNIGIWCAIYNGIEGHNNTIFHYSETESNATDGVYELVEYPGAYVPNDFNFLYHYEDIANLSQSFNHVHSFIGDDLIAFWGIEQGASAPDPDNIEFFLRSDGGAIPNGEYYSITPASLPQTIAKDYQRSTASQRNEVFIEKVGNTYLFRYAFQIWEGYANFNDLRLVVNINFTIDGIAYTTTYESVPFDLANLGTTQNAAPESIALPVNIQYYPVDGGGTPIGGDFGGVVPGYDTLVVAEWKDDINNDLQQDTADLVGWLGVNTNNPNQATFRMIHTEYDPEGGSLWKEPQGHTPTRAQIVRVDLATAQVRAILKYNDLIQYFGNIREVCIMARLDVKQAFTFTTWEITFDLRSDFDDVFLNYIDYTTVKLMPAVELAQFISTAFATDYFLNAVPDTLPNFLASLATAPLGSTIRIQQTATSGSDFSTSYLLKYTNGDTTPAFSTINLPSATNSVAHTDAIVPFDSPIQIDYASMTGIAVYVQIRMSDSDIYSDQVYDVRPTNTSPTPGYQVASALNAALASIPDGTKYELHFWLRSRFDVSFNYTYLVQPTRAREATNTLFDRVDFLPPQNGIAYDGIDQYLETDTTSSLFDISEGSVQAMSVWFYKPEGAVGYPNAQIIAESRTAGGDGWALFYGGGGTTFRFQIQQGASNTVQTAPFAASFKAQWIHVVFQKSGALPTNNSGQAVNTTNWQMYVNGHRTRAIGSRIYDPTTPQSGQKLRLGGVPINTNLGNATAVRNALRVRNFVYRKDAIFTEDEIRAMYHNPSYTTTNPTDLVFDLDVPTLPASIPDKNGLGLNLIPFNNPTVVPFP